MREQPLELARVRRVSGAAAASEIGWCRYATALKSGVAPKNTHRLAKKAGLSMAARSPRDHTTPSVETRAFTHLHQHRDSAAVAGLAKILKRFPSTGVRRGHAH